MNDSPTEHEGDKFVEQGVGLEGGEERDVFCAIFGGGGGGVAWGVKATLVCEHDEVCLRWTGCWLVEHVTTQLGVCILALHECEKRKTDCRFSYHRSSYCFLSLLPIIVRKR
jgi:hypothetical protein